MTTDPVPAGPDELIDAVARVLHARDPHRMHSVFEDDGPSYTETARALAADSLLADPGVQAELERLRSELRVANAGNAFGNAATAERNALRAQLAEAVEMVKTCTGHPDRANPDIPSHPELIQAAQAEREHLSLLLRAMARRTRRFRLLMNVNYREVRDAKDIIVGLLAERDRLQARIDAVPNILRQHYLAWIECDHVQQMDNPQCACSKVDLGWHPTVGDAVNAWIEHVRAALQPALPAVVSPEETP